MTTLEQTLMFIRAAAAASDIKTKRSLSDYLADRIAQAATEPTLMAFAEHLCRALGSDMPVELGMSMIKAAADPDARAVLAWIRQYPRICGMLCVLKKADFIETVKRIELQCGPRGGIAIPDAAHDITIRITCLSPMSHGADEKAGNATLFRRMQVLTAKGDTLTLPYYAGNAFRGQMRDLLADDFIRGIGLDPRRDKPAINLWFFHVLYAGGSLCEVSAGDRAIRARLGGDGAVRAEAVFEFRNTLPHLSLLGCALGNRILSGRFKISDFRPVCREWGYDTYIEAAGLFEWAFLTRREDHEDHDENSSMIANTECLKPGSVLIGGIDVDIHARPMERAALARGLNLMLQHGYIGADNRRGFGKVEISIEGLGDERPYMDYLATEQEKIREYLTEIGALSHDTHTSD